MCIYMSIYTLDTLYIYIHILICYLYITSEVIFTLKLKDKFYGIQNVICKFFSSFFLKANIIYHLEMRMCFPCRIRIGKGI